MLKGPGRHPGCGVIVGVVAIGCEWRIDSERKGKNDIVSIVY
jgi:hypothetical protein